MTASIEWYNGVRLVKTEIQRLHKRDILSVIEGEEGYGFIKYRVASNWQVDLAMTYANDQLFATNVWELYYTFPCAALTFIAEEGTRINSTRPELLTAFDFIALKK